MRSLFRPRLTAERACRAARRHLLDVCGVEYRVVAHECRPLPTSGGDAYIVRCVAHETTYDVAIAPNGAVLYVERHETAKAPSFVGNLEAPRV